jgi:hypothetical protein
MEDSAMKTHEDVEELKRQWLVDPCWDIYETHGFEQHREELMRFQAESEERWARERMNKVWDKSRELGIEGNLALAGYVMKLEARIESLEASAV